MENEPHTNPLRGAYPLQGENPLQGDDPDVPSGNSLDGDSLAGDSPSQGASPAGDSLSDEFLTDQSIQALHLPPGLDLLLQMLDEMSGGFAPPPTEKMTPTPYFRTPSLGS